MAAKILLFLPSYIPGRISRQFGQFHTKPEISRQLLSDFPIPGLSISLGLCYDKDKSKRYGKEGSV